MHPNLLLARLAAFLNAVESRKKDGQSSQKQTILHQLY